MTLFILDSDHVSLLLKGNESIRYRKQQSDGEVATTIITVQEILNGWLSRINDRSALQNPVPLYDKLWMTIEYLKDAPIANYDEAAHVVFRRLLKENPDLRKHRLQRDMRIAAIVLTLGATIVTRNQRDFQLVPGLQMVDWTQG